MVVFKKSHCYPYLMNRNDQFHNALIDFEKNENSNLNSAETIPVIFKTKYIYKRTKY